jgi:hypothetical protein
LGGGSITYMITGGGLIDASVTAALTPVGWIANRIIKRFNWQGRQATVLREFYGHLVANS